MATDKQGYVKYYSADSLKVDESLFTEQDLFSIETNVGLAGGASPKKGGGCNISFDSLFDIDFNLNDFQFDLSSPTFDSSLFDKADQLSLEISMINDMLINSILDMECCDIAKVYNITMIPFFKFFADSGGGDNFITTLVKLSQAITSFRAIVEPLECIVRLVPGNPWMPKDFDFLAWIYGYFKESKPFLDRILSGEMIDIIINPVHNMRVKLQACLVGGIPEGKTFQQFIEVGNTAQLDAISKAAVKDGKPIAEAMLPNKPEPKKPRPEDFLHGEGNQVYQEKLEYYNIAHPKWEKDQKYKAQVKAEMENQSKALYSMNKNLVITSQTKKVIRAHTSGICGCVADALGINDFGIGEVPVRLSGDLSKLNNKAVHGVTNKQAGVVNSHRHKDDTYVREEGDSGNTKATKAVVDSGESKGNAKESSEESDTRTQTNNYIRIDPNANSKITAEVKVIKSKVTSADSYAILTKNDDAQKLLDKCLIEVTQLEADISKNLATYNVKWAARKKAILLKLKQASSYGATSSTPQAIKKSIETEVAQWIYNSHFTMVQPFDMVNDKYDNLTLSNYLTEDAFWSLFPPRYWDVVSTIALEQRKTLSVGARNIPFPPNIPPEEIIKNLPLSENVDVDERFKVAYFDGGFVREKGSRSWRNFNKLDLPYNFNNSIGIDKTTKLYTSIFPSDAIGDKACLDYTKSYPENTPINDYALNELNNNAPRDLEAFFLSLEFKYQIQRYTKLKNITDEDIYNLINEVALKNGYESGKMWVKTRRTDPETQIETEYDYTLENTNTFSIRFNGRAATMEEVSFLFGGPLSLPLPLTDNNTSSSDNVAVAVKEAVNASIKERAPHYEKVVQNTLKRQSIGEGIDSIRSNILNSIASMVPVEKVLDIPCTCDNFMCAILNTIIKYILSAFNKMMEEIVNMITQFLIPDWVKDILRLTKDLMKCLGSIFGIANTISEINKHSDDLLDAMKDRVKMYPADACFLQDIPDIHEEDTKKGLSDTEFGNDDGNEDTSEPVPGSGSGICCGDIYVPPQPGGGNPGGGDNPSRPPVIIRNKPPGDSNCRFILGGEYPLI